MTHKQNLFAALVVLIGLALTLPLDNSGLDTDFHDGRWQWHLKTLLWDWTIDHHPEREGALGRAGEHTGFYLTIPDEYCHENVGGYTGAVHFQFYVNPNSANFVITIHGGEWWGDISRFTYQGYPNGPGIGNWCLPLWYWSLEIFERPEVTEMEDA
jgi:hypothetical protein